jgi:hypothetical protein
MPYALLSNAPHHQAPSRRLTGGKRAVLQTPVTGVAVARPMLRIHLWGRLISCHDIRAVDANLLEKLHIRLLFCSVLFYFTSFFRHSCAVRSVDRCLHYILFISQFIHRSNHPSKTIFIMRFSTLALWLSISTSILSAPLPLHSSQKRALQSLSYNEFQVSDGVAGNALAEVNEKFPVRFPPPFPPLTPASIPFFRN